MGRRQATTTKAPTSAPPPPTQSADDDPSRSPALLLHTGFHNQSAAQALDLLRVDATRGLGAEEAGRRLALFGSNQLASGDADGPAWWAVLGQQLLTPMMAILCGGVVLILATSIPGGKGLSPQEWLEVGVLLLVIGGNVGVGCQQELQAGRTMAALRRMASPTARVLRDTTVAFISAGEVVPGDILLVEEGDVVPADARIVESFHLEVDEAMLTGESVPVQKS